jgi:formylmethanofuran dehydrogenase subunit E
MLAPLSEFLSECEAQHGHLCPGQVLGARMAVLGCSLIGVNDPKGVDRKKLIVWVEIDRCMSDAVSAVTGVRLGRRSLKFMDYGKVAATFLNLESGMAVRLVALESSRQLADASFSHIMSKKERQMCAYTTASDKDLFKIEHVLIEVNQNDLPGHPKQRDLCSKCGEGINDHREVRREDGTILCRPCASGRYYHPVNSDNDLTSRNI